MHVRLDKLRGRPRTVKFSDPASEFPALLALLEQGDVTFTSPVSGDLMVTWAGDAIEASGLLSSSVTLPCSRCLKAVPCDLKVDVLLCYAPVPGEMNRTFDEEKELTVEELGLIPVVGEELDLRPDLEQELIMAFPRQPLCQEDCAGLCPVCGSDQNQQKCNCEQPVFHAGLAALKNFKIDKE